MKKSQAQQPEPCPADRARDESTPSGELAGLAAQSTKLARLVVNGMIAEAKPSLPPSAVRMSEWSHLNVEEIYDLLVKRRKEVPKALVLDLRAKLGSDGDEDEDKDTEDDNLEREPTNLGRTEKLRAHWLLICI